MSAPRNYDPGLHFASFGNIPIRGFAPGTYISVEYMSEAFSSSVGAGGEVARVRSRDNRGKIKVSLIASDPTNDLLASAHVLDKTSGGGTGKFHLMDGGGTTVVNAATAWITKMPQTDFSKELPNRDWEFETDNLELFTGGNKIIGT